MIYGYYWIDDKVVEATRPIFLDKEHPSGVPICDLSCHGEDRWGYFDDDGLSVYWQSYPKKNMPKEFIATLFLLGIN
jgi:hypothetical protein